MKRWRAAAWMLGASLLLGADCAGVPSPKLGIPFRLKPGQSANVKGERVEVGFSRVASDSRCPQGAPCIQAGEAFARLWAREIGSSERNAFEARIGAVQGIDSTTAQAEFQDWRIQLLALEPYPRTGVPVDSSAYVALLRVTRR